MNTSIKPEEIIALVVGIEKYAWSEDFTIHGPATNATRFVGWLQRIKVPRDNIHFFLSPDDEISQQIDRRLDEIIERYAMPRVHYAGATADNIRKMFTHKLLSDSGRLLIIFWSGHGYVSKDYKRRLLYSDADKNDTKNLMFESALDLLRSTDMHGPNCQVIFVDACAHYYGELLSQEFQFGEPNSSIEQYVLYSTSIGQTARVESKQQTTPYADFVLEKLESEISDLSIDLSQLKDKFARLAQAVKLYVKSEAEDQRPSLFVYRNWDGEDYPLGSPPTKENLQSQFQVGIKPIAKLTRFIPPLPNNFVQREDLAKLEHMLCSGKGRYFGLIGMSGTGKSVLSVALARTSIAIQEAFAGGIYWVARPGLETTPVSYQRQLFLQLPDTQEREFRATTWPEGIQMLRRSAEKTVAGARCLIIVDDPPESPDLLDALDIGDHAVFLLVTREHRMLRAKSVEPSAIYELQPMKKNEALELLARWTVKNSAGAKALSETAQAVANKLGYLPVALAMVGAIVRGSVDSALKWQDLYEALQEGELGEITHPVDSYPLQYLSTIFDAALCNLNEDERKLFYNLALFPQQARISLKYLYQIWEPVKERRVRQLVEELIDNSIFQQIGAEDFAIHSLMRLYIRSKVENLSKLYQQIVPRIFPNGTPLIVATEWQDVEAVRSFVNSRWNVNEALANGWTALHAAANQGFTEIGEMLVRAGANIDCTTTKEHQTPLFTAAFQGHIEILHMLLENGAKADPQNIDGFSPLHVAAQNGRADIATLLLEHGATVNLQNTNQRSPLHIAAYHGQIDVVRILLSFAPLHAQETDPTLTPLAWAVQEGHSEVAKMLIEAGATVNSSSPNGQTILHSAAGHGYIEIVKILIEAGAMLDSKMEGGETCLHIAAQNGHLGVVTVLLDTGVQVNALNDAGRTPLYSAVQQDKPDVVKALIDAGSEVNMQDAGLHTPLHVAAFQLNLTITNMLLAASAGTNFADAEGYTAVHFAILKRYSIAFQVHFRDEIGPKGSSFSTVSMFHIEPSSPVVEALVHAGADVNRKTADGRTALHLTAMYGDLASAKILLEGGALVIEKDNKGNTALDLAKANGHAEIVDLLEARQIQ